jgi:hypothetical protein
MVSPHKSFVDKVSNWMHSADMLRFFIALILAFLSAVRISAQECPKENPNGPLIESGLRVIKGVVIFHNGIRRWVELKSVTEVCGTHSVQLFTGRGGAFEVDEGAYLDLERYRGCRLEVQGHLGLPGTGYYSAPIYMNVEKKTVEGPCSLKPKVPTYWNAKPQRGIRRYRVAMSIHYRGDGGVTARVTSAGRELRPWQAYASYMLTGGYVFYGYCAKGYRMTRMQGPPVAKPDQIDEAAALDPETAAEHGVWNLYLHYTCSR